MGFAIATSSKVFTAPPLGHTMVLGSVFSSREGGMGRRCWQQQEKGCRAIVAHPLLKHSPAVAVCGELPWFRSHRQEQRWWRACTQFSALLGRGNPSSVEIFNEFLLTHTVKQTNAIAPILQLSLSARRRSVARGCCPGEEAGRQHRHPEQGGSTL